MLAKKEIVMKTIKKILKWLAWLVLAIALLLIGVCAYVFIGYGSVKPALAYLNKPPVVDGVLDDALQGLPQHGFMMSMRMGPNQIKIGAGDDDVPIHYRMAYGAQFLYLYIEMETPEYVCRDRGYQMGDGFMLILGRPRSWSRPTDDYYILGFSPQDTPAQAWASKIVWQRDYTTILKKLDDDVQFTWKKQSGRVGFELLLPWQVVQPFHPWIQDELGFNLVFVKAVRQQEMLMKTVFPDINMGFGPASNRYYTRLTFKKPQSSDAPMAYLTATRNHLPDTEAIKLETALWSNNGQSQHLTVALEPKAETGVPAISSQFDLSAAPGLQHRVITFDKPVPPGLYTLKWHAEPAGIGGETPLTVFSAKHIGLLETELQAKRHTISQGSADTLAFRIGNFKNAWTKAKYHEALTDLAVELNATWQILQDAGNGRDTLMTASGNFRRAFLSKIDNTYQPYSVIVPPDFDRTRTYPLLVYLHGSERDDQELLNFKPLHNVPGFIVMAPKARGKSNYYVPEAARADVLEAIADVCRNYPIDQKRIVLSGFSMGGYGVYRLFHHAPTRFAGLAIFSGTPQLSAFEKSTCGNADDAIDYLDEQFLPLFRRIPMFISHGRGDRSCPFALTAKLSERLRAQNANVETHFSETGHSGLDPDELNAFNHWLDTWRKGS
jgi:predicted esterase